MRYKYPGKGKVRVSSTSGHVIYVGSDFVEMPPHMEADARMLGCVSEEVFTQARAEVIAQERARTEPLKVPQTISKTDLLAEAMKALVAEGNPNNFTKAGTPRHTALEERVDFTFDSDEVEAVWEQVMAEADE